LYVRKSRSSPNAATIDITSITITPW
jgi:hypothetical protein